MKGVTSERSDAIASMPFLPAPAASAVACAGVVVGLGAPEAKGDGVDATAGDAPACAPLAPAAAETDRSGMTKDPSCMRSGPARDVEVGVDVSHSHESNDETGSRAAPDAVAATAIGGFASVGRAVDEGG